MSDINKEFDKIKLSIIGIESFKLSRNKLNICFLTQKSKITVKFTNPISINLELDSIPGQIEGLDIMDLSNDQWENINYRVWDIEQECLNFYCKSIEILDIGKIDKDFYFT